MVPVGPGSRSIRRSCLQRKAWREACFLSMAISYYVLHHILPERRLRHRPPLWRLFPPYLLPRSILMASIPGYASLISWDRSHMNVLAFAPRRSLRPEPLTKDARTWATPNPATANATRDVG